MAEAVAPIALTVNGTPYRLAVDPEVPLLYVLRNELGLVGTRFGCGTGACGACTVIVGAWVVRRAFGIHGEGPIERPEDLRPALERALRVVKEERRAALVDVVTQPR